MTVNSGHRRTIISGFFPWGTNSRLVFAGPRFLSLLGLRVAWPLTIDTVGGWGGFHRRGAARRTLAWVAGCGSGGIGATTTVTAVGAIFVLSLDAMMYMALTYPLVVETVRHIHQREVMRQDLLLVDDFHPNVVRADLQPVLREDKLVQMVHGNGGRTLQIGDGKLTAGCSAMVRHRIVMVLQRQTVEMESKTKNAQIRDR
uniref:Uncharacterized protein n=1 Tax=Anopheles culicifacies TaxID=139723 RepID=A0A182MC93_9DIPT